MSAYSDIIADVYTWTNRPYLVQETAMAVRQALRMAHRAGTFPRDFVETTVAMPSTNDAVKLVDLSISCPLYRQLVYVKPLELDFYYTTVDVRDVLGDYGVAKSDVFWVVGQMLNIRPSAQATALKICYLGYPDTSNLETSTDWLLVHHQELVTLWAAASVLATANEQEIKTRVEALAKIAYEDLIQTAVESIGR